MFDMSAELDEVFDHELVGISARSELCSCGDSSPSYLEHIATVTLAAMHAPPARKKPQLVTEPSTTSTVLAILADRQDRLRAELDAAGLTDFNERIAWLIEHRTPDECAAWRKRWGGFEPAAARRPRAHFTIEQLEAAERAQNNLNAAA